MRDGIFILLALLLSAYSAYQLFYVKQRGVGHDRGEMIASIEEISNEVRHKSYLNLSWEESYKGVPLFFKDMIFTGDNSSTIILTKSNIKIFVSPNTLLTLNESSGLLDLNLRQGIVDIIMQKNIEPRITTKGLVINNVVEKSVVRMEKKDKLSEESLSVIKGKVEVDDKNDQKGKLLSLDNQKTVILGAQNLVQEKQVQLTPISPEPGEKLIIENGSPVNFSWTSSKPFSQYKILITDLNDKKNIIEDSTTALRFEYPLREGQYSYQVTGIDDQTAVITSPVQFFQVIERTVAPLINLSEFTPFSGTYVQIPFGGSKNLKLTWKKSIRGNPQALNDLSYVIKIYKKEGGKGVLKESLQSNTEEVSYNFSNIGTYVWTVTPQSEKIKSNGQPKQNFIKIDNERPPAPKVKNIEMEMFDDN